MDVSRRARRRPCRAGRGRRRRRGSRRRSATPNTRRPAGTCPSRPVVAGATRARDPRRRRRRGRRPRRSSPARDRDHAADLQVDPLRSRRRHLLRRAVRDARPSSITVTTSAIAATRRRSCSTTRIARPARGRCAARARASRARRRHAHGGLVERQHAGAGRGGPGDLQQPPLAGAEAAASRRGQPPSASAAPRAPGQVGRPAWSERTRRARSARRDLPVGRERREAGRALERVRSTSRQRAADRGRLAAPVGADQRVDLARRAARGPARAGSRRPPSVDVQVGERTRAPRSARTSGPGADAPGLASSARGRRGGGSAVGGGSSAAVGSDRGLAAPAAERAPRRSRTSARGETQGGAREGDDHGEAEQRVARRRRARRPAAAAPAAATTSAGAATPSSTATPAPAAAADAPASASSAALRGATRHAQRARELGVVAQRDRVAARPARAASRGHERVGEHAQHDRGDRHGRRGVSVTRQPERRLRPRSSAGRVSPCAAARERREAEQHGVREPRQRPRRQRRRTPAPRRRRARP